MTTDRPSKSADYPMMSFEHDRCDGSCRPRPHHDWPTIGHHGTRGRIADPNALRGLRSKTDVGTPHAECPAHAPTKTHDWISVPLARLPNRLRGQRWR